MNTEQFTTDISNLEKFLTELEKCHRYKLIGYALVPLIIGIFILRKVNTDIAQRFSQISSIEEKIIKEISSNLDNLQEQSQNILSRDTYLIYIEKKTLLDQYTCVIG